MKKLASILLVFLIVTACNQDMIGVGFAVKNFFSLPFNATKSLVTDELYDNAMTNTKKDQQPDYLQGKSKEEHTISMANNYCVSNDDKSNENKLFDDLSAIAQKINNPACQCRAWGTCHKTACSCQKLCPDNFHIFKRPPFLTDTKNYTLPENGLAFRNERVGTIKMTQGFCWGHARINSQFNRLAFFGPDELAPFDLNSNNEDEQNKAIDYYKGLIDKITSNEATSIPGFKNLNEFSDHPALQSYLGDKMATTWAKSAMSIQGIRVGLGVKKESNEYYQKTFDEIKEKLSLGVQPTILFTQKGHPFNTHAILISHTENKPEIGEVMCVRDNNRYDETNLRCDYYLELNEDGLHYYGGGGTLGKMEVAHNENSDMVIQKNSLLKRCQNEKKCKPVELPKVKNKFHNRSQK